MRFADAHLRRKIAITIFSLLAVNALIWAATFITFYHFALLLWTCALAYVYGLQHALDADHISVIDNVTRKLMQDGKKPVGVGLFFSLGHSTIVILVSAIIALTTSQIQSHFPALAHVGGLAGTFISALFLLIIAAINLLILRGVFRAFVRVRSGESYDEQDMDAILAELGFVGRIFRPVLKLVDKSWKMYVVGFLFGLGFDTATYVALLGIAAAAAMQGMHVWDILVFPLLFTAGMCLVDTTDGILMLGAYGWAFVHPIRKLYYNMTITAVSVLIALFVGGIEILGALGAQLNLHGQFWNAVGWLGDDHQFWRVGVSIIAIFITAWVTSVLAYRFMGYHRLELATNQLPPR